MIIKGKPVDGELLRVQKSIADSLKNKKVFQAENKDTSENSTELHPPIPMQDCLYVFEHSSHVAKSSRILAADVIYNDITLSLNTLDEPDEHQINQVKKINDYLNDNIDELYNMAVDYNYAAWAVMEYVWNNTRFSLKQVPVHTCKVIKATVNGKEVYLLKQYVNGKTKFFKIMGEEYPDDFLFFAGQRLSHVSLMGGDNIYQFFGLPRWAQDYNEILTEIAISENDYKTVSNGNISSGVLNINLEPQLPQPIQYDEEGNPLPVKSREEVISKELQSANGGTAVIFTESNRQLNMDYVSLANSNQSYLSELGDKCQRAVLNDYNIPLIRMMINTEKESMNSNKSNTIWQIYNLNLKNEQKPYKTWIKELIYELYSLDVNVDMTTPSFADIREIEVNMMSQAWNDGALTLRQFIEGLSQHLSVINLEDYDFTVNADVWNFRKIPELEVGLSEDDIAIIESVEAQLKEV